MKQKGWQKTWIRIVTTLLTVSVMVMIFCFSMENAAESDQRSGNVSMTVIRLFCPEYSSMEPLQKNAMFDQVQFIVRKCAHFTEYLLLGFMIRLCVESWFGCQKRICRRLQLISFMAGVLYACTDEIHQLAIEGRSGMLTDVIVDSGGVFAGVWVGLILIDITKRRFMEQIKDF